MLVCQKAIDKLASIANRVHVQITGVFPSIDDT